MENAFQKTLPVSSKYVPPAAVGLGCWKHRKLGFLLLCFLYPAWPPNIPGTGLQIYRSYSSAPVHMNTRTQPPCWEPAEPWRLQQQALLPSSDLGWIIRIVYFENSYYCLLAFSVSSGINTLVLFRVLSSSTKQGRQKPLETEISSIPKWCWPLTRSR